MRASLPELRYAQRRRRKVLQRLRQQTMTRLRHCALGVLCALCVLGMANRATAQGGFAMPDPKEMSGIPRPVDDLPNGAISVRLIRGQLSNNIANHPVELHAGGKVLTVKTDENGRAQFNEVPPGSTVKATADVDGEHLESREFPAPTRGGIRVRLCASDTSTPAASPGAPAATGAITIGTQSRVVIQPNDEVVEIFYLLDLANTASTPVNPPTPFVFEMPSGCGGASIMEGSSPQAKAKGTTVSVEGPFAPGHTFLQVACAMPGEGGTIDFIQRFPAALEQLAVVVKKVGDTTFQSPQVAQQREMPADGETFIAATGGQVAANQPIELIVSGFPAHSSAPRYVALTLAAFIAFIGVWAGPRPASDEASLAAQRKQLIARRDKLFNELVRLENDYRKAKIDERRYAPRREELLASLEQVYSALDTHDAGPEPASRAGLAA